MNVNIVLVWRMVLYLPLLGSVACLKLQRFFSVRREAAAPGEVCGVGAVLQVFFLSGLFALIVAGRAHGRDRCWLHCSKLKICAAFFHRKFALCVEVWLDGEMSCFWFQLGFVFFTFAYTNMQNDLYEMPNSPFTDSKTLFKNSRKVISDTQIPFIFPWPVLDLVKFYVPPVPVFVLPGSVSDGVPPSDRCT